ncbi:MAG TPA: N-acetylmuramoyl-L-alanine amidase [Polyangiaceae bacterium]|nr:N-acetylmuramoyl-L-alanine amidase [Polyangiaceae bacterium]
MNAPRDLKRGMTGSDVAAWQRFVLCPALDGIFGEQTETLTKMWQQHHALKADGVVGPITRAAAEAATTVPPPHVQEALPTPATFIKARNFTKGRYGSPVTLVVLHTMENAEKPMAARAVAQWFAGDTAPQASAHFCVDALEIVQCVAESDSAWAAPGANRNGLHIEHAGRAGQSTQDWSDAFSEAMLRRSAALCADLCRRHGIPIKRLSAAEVRAGARGICGHIDVTIAFPDRKGTHWDPGPNFPWASYLELVMAADGMGGKQTSIA